MQLDQTLDHKDYGYNDQRTQGYDNPNMHASKHSEHKIQQAQNDAMEVIKPQ